MIELPPLLILFLFAVVCAVLAHGRGRSPVAWFILGGIFHCFALIGLLVLPDLEVERQRHEKLARENQRLRELLRKDRQVSDARHAEVVHRLDRHDRAAGIDTRPPAPSLETAAAPRELPPPGESPFDGFDWYFVLDGEARGPVPFGELRELRSDGLVHDQSLLWHDGLDEWTPADEIPGLRQALHG